MRVPGGGVLKGQEKKVACMALEKDRKGEKEGKGRIRERETCLLRGWVIT